MPFLRASYRSHLCAPHQHDLAAKRCHVVDRVPDSLGQWIPILRTYGCGMNMKTYGCGMNVRMGIKETTRNWPDKEVCLG